MKGQPQHREQLAQEAFIESLPCDPCCASMLIPPSGAPTPCPPQELLLLAPPQLPDLLVGTPRLSGQCLCPSWCPGWL